jgi:hypothetical protein
MALLSENPQHVDLYFQLLTALPPSFLAVNLDLRALPFHLRALPF